jgi:hypothetical protein
VSCTPNYAFNLSDFITIWNCAFTMIEKFTHSDLNLSSCEKKTLKMKVLCFKITPETDGFDFCFCKKYSWKLVFI